MSPTPDAFATTLSDSDAPLRPGDVIDGRYRVDALLGDGGMARVYRATHQLLDTRVAIKVMAPHLRTVPGVVQRFVREARAATQLKGEHVVRVFDVGALPGGIPFLVMEHLEGSDLGEIVAVEGPLDVDQAVAYVLQTCEALAEVHGIGIVHRDLKPANLFITKGTDGKPCLKLIDFGIAGYAIPTDAAAMRVTGPQVILGSPQYMAPEQMECSAKADVRSDIYGVGAVLYELLTGVTPYEGCTSIGDLFAAMATKQPVAPSELRDDVPSELDEVVLRCLRIASEHRYPDVAELADALLPFAPEGYEACVERIECIMHTAQTRSEHPSLPDQDGEASVHSGVRPRIGSRHTGRTSRNTKSKRKPHRVARFAITALGFAGAAIGALAFATNVSPYAASMRSHLPALTMVKTSVAADVGKHEAREATPPAAAPAPSSAPQPTQATLSPTNESATVAPAKEAKDAKDAGAPQTKPGAAATAPSSNATPTPANRHPARKRAPMRDPHADRRDDEPTREIADPSGTAALPEDETRATQQL